MNVRAHSLPKPTVPEVIPVMRKYAALPGNNVGGSLHIVLDDGNVDDGSVRHCIEWARERADVAGVELGEMLLRMSRTQRKKLAALFYAPNAALSGRRKETVNTPHTTEELASGNASAPCRGSAVLNVGQLKKQLERVPDDASVCMMVLGRCAAPMRVIWCVKDNGVIITSD